MNTLEPSLIQLLFAGILGSFGGYLLRKFQKFDEMRDEIFLKFLPSLNYSVSSFIDAVDIFCSNSQLSPFIDEIVNINKKLVNSLYSGEILFLKQSLKEQLLCFSKDLRKFQVVLEENKDHDDIIKTIKHDFKYKHDFLDTHPSNLLDDAKNIQNTIESELMSFKSYLYYLIIVIFLLGFMIAAIQYFKI